MTMLDNPKRYFKTFNRHLSCSWLMRYRLNAELKAHYADALNENPDVRSPLSVLGCPYDLAESFSRQFRYRTWGPRIAVFAPAVFCIFFFGYLLSLHLPVTKLPFGTFYELNMGDLSWIESDDFFMPTSTLSCHLPKWKGNPSFERFGIAKEFAKDCNSKTQVIGETVPTQVRTSYLAEAAENSVFLFYCKPSQERPCYIKNSWFRDRTSEKEISEKQKYALVSIAHSGRANPDQHHSNLTATIFDAEGQKLAEYKNFGFSDTESFDVLPFTLFGIILSAVFFAIWQGAALTCFFYDLLSRFVFKRAK